MLYNSGMMRVGSSRGFTMVETVIFLAVSSALFVSAMLLMSGQQAKTEFRQAIGEVQSRVDDVANDVSTGYYATNDDVTCRIDAGAPKVENGAAEKGTNNDCIFLGRAVQFGTDTDNTVINIYNIVGRRLDSVTQKPVTTLSEAVATLMGNQYDTSTMPSGLTVYNAFYKADPDAASIPINISGFVFASSLASFNAATGSIASGNSTVDVIAIPGSIYTSPTGFGSAVNTGLQSNPSTVVKNPGGGVGVCLDSGGTDQHIILRIGVGGDLASTLTIKNGKSSSDTTECGVI